MSVSEIIIYWQYEFSNKFGFQVEFLLLNPLQKIFHNITSPLPSTPNIIPCFAEVDQIY
uniref:Uncharacterized protein n=1 Tax=Octopus bimaculoides TaxID=37653 RepID=A0A0L8GHS1_OCTBM